MPVPSKDLADLADQMFPPAPGMDLSDAGPASRTIRDKITMSESRTRPFVASVFWQAVMGTPFFSFYLARLAADYPEFQVKLIQVVPHGPQSGALRFDLLILADGLPDPDLYITTDVKPFDDELRQGSAVFVRDALIQGTGSIFANTINHAEVAIEAIHAQPFSLLVLPAPRMIPTAFRRPGPISVVETISGEKSTAGVLCVNRKGQSGVTVALHAIKDQASVEIDGMPGQVVTTHSISDSAFVQVALSVAGNFVANYLTNLVPRTHEPVHFTGLGSNVTRHGNVTGFSPQLPTVSLNAQLVVTTGPISTPGDSGAALLDGQDVVLGFCYEVSEFGAPNPYSSWIWAESVFKAHGLS